jgi:hypothetical protein
MMRWHVRLTARTLVAVGAGIFTAGASWTAATGPTPSAIRTSAQSRVAYLAHALIWRDPGALSPTDLLEGPAGAFPYTFERATADEGIACTFAQAGKNLGGHTRKFLCRTAEGQNLRLKYWDPESRTGNREVFAIVAASRLMWALGFQAVPALPLNARCDRCPEDPMSGLGSPGTRRYFAMWQAPWPTPVIISHENIDEGWSWLDLDSAIRSLPAGPERARQRAYFDALALFGVFIQHGDRKSEQQRLYCAVPADTTPDTLEPDNAPKPLIFFERAGAAACLTSAVTIVDLGATFGGAGRESNDTTAKMNLEAWQRKPVFKDAARNECRGELTISLRAHDGEGNPIISEEGRLFLLEQLHRLTPDHVRAIFTAARVDQLNPRSGHKSAGGAGVIDEWVAAFQDKVRQIEVRRCQPAG